MSQSSTHQSNGLVSELEVAQVGGEINQTSLENYVGVNGPLLN